MKKIFSMLIFVLPVLIAGAQGFEQAIGTAKTAYGAGKLEEAHFALLQAMQEVDIIIGKEVLKLLPAKMDDRQVNTADDQVTANAGFIGATIHRSYGESPRKVDLSIISNSPLVATLNTLMNAPLLGGMMNDANNKTVKVQGYKARLSGSDLTDGKKQYEFQIPLGSSLVTFTIPDCTEQQAMTLANTLPMQQIAKLIQ